MMERRARSRLVFCLTFLFIFNFLVLFKGPTHTRRCTAWSVRCEGDRMTPQSGFYLNLFLTLNSTPLIGNNFDVPYSSRRDVTFFQKRKKKKDMKTKCGVK